MADRPKRKAGRPSKAEEMGLKGLLDRAWPVARRLKLFEQLAAMSEQGNIEAIKLLTAYTFGKPTEHHNVTGVQEIRVVYGDSASSDN